MGKNEYYEKLKDPRWQKKRLEIFKRDNFTCQSCFADDITLTVHHLYYEKGKEPWDYPNQALITLCIDCHRQEAEQQYETEKELIQVLRSCGLFNSDLYGLALSFNDSHFCHVPEVVITMLGWILHDDVLQKELLEKYFNHIAVERKSKKS